MSFPIQRDETPARTSGESHREVQLCVMVPPEIRKQLRSAAKQQETTVRTVVLRALRDAGLIDMPDPEITGRRTTVAALKSTLYRAAKGL
jgi:predicted deacylase